MRRLLQTFSKRSHAIKHHRNRVNTCAHVGPLRNFYYQLFTHHYDKICNLFPVASFPFMETVVLAAQAETVNLEKAYLEVLRRIAKLSPESPNSSNQFSSPRDLISLASCIDILTSERSIKKSYFMPAYDILVDKGGILRSEDAATVDSYIHGSLDREPTFNYLRDTQFDIIRRMSDVTRHSKNFRKSLELPYSDDVSLDIPDPTGESLVISRRGECNILLHLYEEHSIPSVGESLEVMRKEVPMILALDARPRATWQTPVLIEKTMQEHIDVLRKDKDNKEIVEPHGIINENVKGISRISFNDTMVYKFLGLMRMQPPLYKARMSCLFYKMHEQDELEYLASNVDYKKAEELFGLSKYHRLCESIHWLDTVYKHLCPQCGEEVRYPPEVWFNLMSEGDFSREYQRNYAANKLVNLIKEERKFTDRPIKVLMFANYQEYPLMAKAVYNALLSKEDAEDFVLPKKPWEEIEADDQENYKAAMLATAFHLQNAGKRGVFKQGGQFLKFQDWRKELEDDYTFTREIQRGWEGKRTNHRCYAVKLLVDKTLPLFSIHYNE